MVDCENEVYTRVKNAVLAEIPGVDFSGEYELSPAALPHVYMRMSDNGLLASRTTDGREFALPMFAIDIYSNKPGGKKTECKKIAQVIDKTMFSMNFERLSMTEVPNMDSATIYRLVLRYQGVTDGQFFYRR